MKIRIGFGAAMLAGVMGALWLDWFLDTHGMPVPAAPLGGPKGLCVTALLACVAVAGFLELAQMAKAVGTGVLTVSGIGGTLLVATAPAWFQWMHIPSALGWAIAGVVVMAMFFEQMVRYRVEDALRRLACTSLAVLYLGVGLAIILLTRQEFGVPVLVLFLAAVKFTDIGAYFTGSAIGRHKLIPWLSPGKSWEGLAGGVLTAACVSVLVTWTLNISLFGPMSDCWALCRVLVFGAVVGAAGQFADLCESLLKRSAGMKDSGALVPEFGGVLDIIDSPLLSAPVAYILLTILR